MKVPSVERPSAEPSPRVMLPSGWISESASPVTVRSMVPPPVNVAPLVTVISVSASY